MRVLNFTWTCSMTANIPQLTSKTRNFRFSFIWGWGFWGLI